MCDIWALAIEKLSKSWRHRTYPIRRYFRYAERIKISLKEPSALNSNCKTVKEIESGSDCDIKVKEHAIAKSGKFYLPVREECNLWTNQWLFHWLIVLHMMWTKEYIQHKHCRVSHCTVGYHTLHCKLWSPIFGQQRWCLWSCAAIQAHLNWKW